MKFHNRHHTIEGVKQLINSQLDLTEEEKEILKKLTEEPTSLSADLVPKTNSFATNYVPKPVDVNQARTTSKEQFRPLTAKTSLGIGFDPAGIEPESGFKPIQQYHGSSIPTLAFSVLDGAERPPVRKSLYEQDLVNRRQEIVESTPEFNNYEVNF